MTSLIADMYRECVRSGGLQHDPAQLEAAGRLDELRVAVQAWRPPGSGLLGFLTGRGHQVPKGLYIHGQVGRGKTMLMDLFFDRVVIRRKRRVHFHEFMAEVHDRIAAARAQSKGDPIPIVAGQIVSESRLLCFDELHVTDIADAMILGRLFDAMFKEGIVIVATSNALPEELYKNGLNRDLFLPFISMLHRNMDVVELAAARDFRLEKLSGRRLYFTPADATAKQEMDAIWASLTSDAEPSPGELLVKGRRISVPAAAAGVARFPFGEICGKPLGSNDYLSIARAYHTVMIDGIPVLGPAKRNEARRFINLVDTLYDMKVSLVASADAEAVGIYPQGDGAYLFERTISRLIEMRSESYLASRAERAEQQSSSARETERAEA